PAAGDQRVSAVHLCVLAQVLELAGLVAAAGQAGGVVALDPQGVLVHVEVGGQPAHRLERRRQVGEDHPTIKGVDRRHRPHGADATVGPRCPVPSTRWLRPRLPPWTTPRLSTTGPGPKPSPRPCAPSSMPIRRFPLPRTSPSTVP